MKSISKLIITFNILIVFTACGPSTNLTQTWTDPSVNSATFKPFKKVLVLTRLKDETSNRIAEDKLVAQFKPGVAVPAYSYLTAGDTIQKAVDAKLQRDGFDGLLIMNLTAVDKTINVDSYGYGGYYHRGYGNTTVSTDQSFKVETKIYSFESGKLLWSGTTSTLNPASLEKALDEIIVAVKNQLTKQGLIKQPVGESGSGK